jgi:hypothetical protein
LSLILTSILAAQRADPRAWARDNYGAEYGPRGLFTFERHPLCTCSRPCAGRFRCASSHHRGPRETPWCCGGDDEDPGGRVSKATGEPVERCDDCWCAVERSLARRGKTGRLRRDARARERRAW